MKTINFLTSHFVPENTACTNRVLAFVRELEKRYKVNVICLTQRGEFREDLEVKYSDDIDIYYVNQKQVNGKNFFKRAFSEIYYIFQLVKLAKKNESDLTIATSPYMFMIPLVGFLITGPKILDIRDLVWEYLDDKSFVKRSIKTVLAYVMKKGIQKFTLVTVTNDYEAKLLKNDYNINHVNILFNGIEENRYEKLIKVSKPKASSFSVTYVGNIGLAQNIMTLIHTAKRLVDVKFVIIGDGIELKELKEYVVKHNIDNIVFKGNMAWHMLEEYYNNTSVLYAQLDEKYISAIPSKLYEYAAIGLPIIYGGVGQAVTFVKSLENTAVVRPGDIDELVIKIQELKEKDVTISNNNRLLIRSMYLREKSAEDMKELVYKIIG